MADLGLLKVSEVAAELYVSRPTVHRLIRDGRLEAVRVGPRSTRVWADSVKDLLAAGLAKGAG